MIDSYRKIWLLLLPKERQKMIMLLLATIVMAIFEVIGVGIILPFIAVLTDASALETQPLLRGYINLLGIKDPRSGQIAVGVAALVLIIAGMFVRALVTYMQFRFALMRGYTLSSRLLHGYLSQNYIWHVSRNSSEMSTSILSEVDMVVRESILPAVLLVSNLLVVLLIGGLIFFVSPVVAISMLVLLLVVYLGVFFILRSRITQIGEARSACNRKRFSSIKDITSGFKELKILGIELQSLQQFRKPAEEMAMHQTMSQVYARLPRFAVEGTIYSVFILTSMIMVSAGDTQIEDQLPLLGLLGMAALRMFPALQMFYQQLNLLRFSAPALERLLKNLQEAKTRPLRSPPAPLPLHESIVLKDVYFTYPGAGRTGLDGINLTIPKRSTIGLVGGTGAGKTTLVDILLGLLTPDDGEIQIDSKLLADDTIRAWQRNIGYVPQQIFLMDTSVAANIAFGGDHPIDMRHIERAAKAAQLHEFITSELSEGYDTLVGESGVRLSGGQRQRLGIARALYRDPEVLFLDEATSALDNLTEKAVIKAVEGLSGKKTIVMIAHRLSTVRNCDQIVFMQRGRITAMGTYDQLIEENADFREIADA